MIDFLTISYQIPEGSPYLSRKVIDRLLQLDGLIKVYPIYPISRIEADLSDCEWGTIFMAAFIDPKNDYHFMRYFKDGWYERVGDKIRKRPYMLPHIPLLDRKDEIEIKEKMQKLLSRKRLHIVDLSPLVKQKETMMDKRMKEAFNSKENGGDLEGFQFVGYYLVPKQVLLADKVGRKYILEHHKM